MVQLILVAFEHSVLRVWEIYALENAVFCIAVYGLYKPYISSIRNMQCSNATEINCIMVLLQSHGTTVIYPAKTDLSPTHAWLKAGKHFLSLAGQNCSY